MRIHVAIVLIVLLTASYVAWRLKPRDVTGGRTRIVWTSVDNPARRAQMDLFNRRHPDIELTLDPANNTLEKIIVQSVAGIGPDLFDVFGRYALYSFVEADIPLDVTEAAARYGFGPDATWPAAAESVMIGGRQYAFPCQVAESVLFYNKALFDKYKVPYPPRDWTWDQFIRTASKLTRKAPAGRGYECFGAITIDWYESVLQAGGRMYTPDGTRCILDSPEAVEATEYYHDLMHKHHVMPTPEDLAALSSEGGWGGTETGNFNLFTGQRVAMIRAGRWGLITFRTSPALRGRIGVCHVPYRRKNVSLVWTRACAVNRNSRNIEPAIEFLRFLTSPEYNRRIVAGGDSLPPIPAFAQTEEFLRDPDHPEEDFNDVFVEAVRRGVVAEVSPFINPIEAYNVMLEQINFMTSGLKSPRQACRDMTAAVNRIIFQNLSKYEKFRQRYLKATGKPFDANGPEWKIN